MNFSWNIESLFVKKTEGEFSDVVVNANWKCSAVDGDYSASTCGCVEFAPPSGSLTPYPDLTEQQVLGWCYAAGVDKDSAEAAVAQQIEQQKNPPIITPPLPWPTGGIDASTLTAPPKPVVVESPAPVIEAPVE